MTGIEHCLQKEIDQCFAEFAIAFAEKIFCQQYDCTDSSWWRAELGCDRLWMLVIRWCHRRFRFVAFAALERNGKISVLVFYFKMRPQRAGQTLQVVDADIVIYQCFHCLGVR